MGTNRFGRATLPLVGAALSAGCATHAPPPAEPGLPTYRDIGIRLSGSTRGVLYRSGHCVLMKLGDQTIVPIWPEGTRLTPEGVVVPPANGGTLLRFGEVAYLHGGNVGPLSQQPERAQPYMRQARACSDRAFMVNTARTQRQMEAAAPQSPYNGGLLVRRGACLVVENVEGVLLPIWPPGTEVTERTVITPNLRGHAPLLIGGRVGLHGRYVHADDGSLERAAGPAGPRCAKRGMLVERAGRVYLADNPREHAAMSDAVIVVQVLGIDPSEPLGDGFLTTVTGRVVEKLAGSSFAPGQIVRLRHSAGQNESGQWQVATHDPLYQPFGHLRVNAGGRLLLFVNADAYRQTAEARGGRPAASYTGGAIYPLHGDRILQDGVAILPETLTALRAELRP